jgi:hypothetical protein
VRLAHQGPLGREHHQLGPAALVHQGDQVRALPQHPAQLRTAYAGLPHPEVAAMVGGNAARVHGFDLPALDALVDEVARPLAAPRPAPPVRPSPPAPASGSGDRLR